MRIHFIIGTILFFFSMIYLGNYLSFKSTVHSKIYKMSQKNNLSKIVFLVVLPLTCSITCIFTCIYIYVISKELSFLIFFVIATLLMILVIFIIQSGHSRDLGAFMFGFTSLAMFFAIFFILNIEIEKTITNYTLKLYNAEYTDSNLDLTGLICNLGVNISEEEKNDDETDNKMIHLSMPHAIMQYDKNALNDIELENFLTCNEFKLINDDNDRLEIVKNEVTVCNLLRYHGFESFKLNTYEPENIPNEYVLYINPKNISSN